MSDSKINRIEKDKYGNVIKRIFNYNDYSEERTYTYNEFHDLIEYRTIAYNCGNKSEFIMNYVYEYDQYSNKLKVTQTSRTMCGVLNKSTSYLNENTSYYLNEYDENQRLKEVTRVNETKDLERIEKYYYKDSLLERKEEFRSPFDKAYKISYYHYINDNLLYEKKCCLPTGELSHYIKYKMLSDGGYSKRLQSPIKGEYQWLLDEVFDKMCSFYMKEETLKPSMVKEVCDYAIRNYPMNNFIRIDVCESEDITFHKEIKELEEYYNKNFNLTIVHDF